MPSRGEIRKTRLYQTKLLGWIERRSDLREIHYQTYGTNRCRTCFWYSVYPGRFSARNFSSSKSRQIRNDIINRSARSPQYEPSASGVPTRYRNALAYIGCRTSAYGPVEMTF